MGAAPSVLANELSKPSDCSDLVTDKEARNEVLRLRKLLHDHQYGLETAISATGQAPPTKSGSSSAECRLANIKHFDEIGVEKFLLEKSPELSDCLANEFNRFQVSTSDQVTDDTSNLQEFQSPLMI